MKLTVGLSKSRIETVLILLNFILEKILENIMGNQENRRMGYETNKWKVLI